jgi:endoglucanase
MRLGELHSGEYRQRQTMTESNLEMTVHKLRTRQVGAVLARLVAVLVGALFFLTVTVGFAQTARDPGTAQRRAAHLRHGINLSEWFAQVYDQKGYTKEHFETWNTAQDIALIRAMGFDHVRLSVNPQPMFRRNQADHIPADYLSYLDAAMKMILDQGLAVIIDIHPESDFKQKLATDDSFVEQFADYWRALARHYAVLNSEFVFFEILNEPEFHDRFRWQGVQAKLAVAIREGAPQQTIIAAGAYWSSESELLFFDPLRDANIIYNFHFYDPHIFTHQGATWSTNYVHYLKDLPYPSTPENVQQAAALIPDAVNRLQAIHYGLDRWNAARVDGEIGQVAAWTKRWNVPVICNEFGVYRKSANPQDRAAWISDVRRTLERYAIGWTMWDYSGGFGVVSRQEGQPAVPDAVTVEALGMRMPTVQH